MREVRNARSRACGAAASTISTAAGGAAALSARPGAAMDALVRGIAHLLADLRPVDHMMSLVLGEALARDADRVATNELVCSVFRHLRACGKKRTALRWTFVFLDSYICAFEGGLREWSILTLILANLDPDAEWPEAKPTPLPLYAACSPRGSPPVPQPWLLPHVCRAYFISAQLDGPCRREFTRLLAGVGEPWSDKAVVMCDGDSSTIVQGHSHGAEVDW